MNEQRVAAERKRGAHDQRGDNRLALDQAEEEQEQAEDREPVTEPVERDRGREQGGDDEGGVAQAAAVRVRRIVVVAAAGSSRPELAPPRLQSANTTSNTASASGMAAGPGLSIVPSGKAARLRQMKNAPVATSAKAPRRWRPAWRSLAPGLFMVRKGTSKGSQETSRS